MRRIFYGSHRQQYVLQIGDENSKRPVAFYFHGGAWAFGSPHQFLPAAAPFLEAGYQVIMPSYRKMPFHHFGHIKEDLTTILQLLPAAQKRQSALVAGMSAGGHLAAWLSLQPKEWKQAGWDYEPRAAVLCGAVLDLDSMPGATVLNRLRGPREGQLYQLANPLYQLQYIEGLSTRYLIIHGNADGMAPFSQMLGFYEVLIKKSNQVETMWLNEGTHLDACRWMFKDDDVGRKIRAFMARK
ncbi:MAG: alpha/beta hydrolase [Bacteroidota bacterium]